MSKGKHFMSENKKSKKYKIPIWVVSAVVFIIITCILCCTLLFEIGKQIDEIIDEATPDQSMTLGVHLITDEDYTQYPTRFVQPTQSTIHSTIKPTQETEPTNSITKPTNDKVETKPDEIETTIHDDSVNNGSGRYLMEIDDPDYTYTPMAIHLNNDDRALAAKIIMNEFGDGGFEACCLQAQALRDAMIYSRSSLEQIYHFFQYDKYPLLKIPNQDCYNAIDYVFESGGLAVPHRVLVMYNPQHAKSDWHESQEFVIEYQGVRYFDM